MKHKQFSRGGVICLIFVLSFLTREANGQSANEPLKNNGKPAIINSLGMEMVEVEAGTFIMGSNKGNWDELSLHDVSISKNYYISREEISLEQYRQFNPSYSEDSRTGKVIGVSWFDAVAFCKWLSTKEGKTYSGFYFNKTFIVNAITLYFFRLIATNAFPGPFSSCQKV